MFLALAQMDLKESKQMAFMTLAYYSVTTFLSILVSLKGSARKVISDMIRNYPFSTPHLAVSEILLRLFLPYFSHKNFTLKGMVV